MKGRNADNEGPGRLNSLPKGITEAIVHAGTLLCSDFLGIVILLVDATKLPSESTGCGAGASEFEKLSTSTVGSSDEHGSPSATFRLSTESGIGDTSLGDCNSSAMLKVTMN